MAFPMTMVTPNHFFVNFGTIRMLETGDTRHFSLTVATYKYNAVVASSIPGLRG